MSRGFCGNNGRHAVITDIWGRGIFLIWITLKRGALTHAPTPRALEKIFAFQILRTKTTSISLFKKMIFAASEL